MWAWAGARGVQRAVQRRIAVPLSKLMLRHRLDAVRSATAVSFAQRCFFDVRFVVGFFVPG